MVVDFTKGEIYLWVRHSETGSTGEVTYDFDEFGWDEFYGYPQDPADLAGGPVFAGMVSDDPDDAGYASISAIRVTQE